MSSETLYFWREVDCIQAPLSPITAILERAQEAQKPKKPHLYARWETSIISWSEVWTENVKKHCFPLLQVCLNVYVLLEMFHDNQSMFGSCRFWQRLRLCVHYQSSPPKNSLMQSSNIHFMNVRSIFSLHCELEAWEASWLFSVKF